MLVGMAAGECSSSIPNSAFHDLLEQLRQEHDREVRELRSRLTRDMACKSDTEVHIGTQDTSQCAADSAAKMTAVVAAWTVPDEVPTSLIQSSPRASSPCVLPLPCSQGSRMCPRSLSPAGSEYSDASTNPPGPTHSSLSLQDAHPEHQTSGPLADASPTELTSVLKNVLPFPAPAPPGIAPSHPPVPHPTLMRMQAMARAAAHSKQLHQKEYDLHNFAGTALPGSLPEDGIEDGTTRTMGRKAPSILKASGALDRQGSESRRLLRSVSFDSSMDETKEAETKRKEGLFRLRVMWVEATSEKELHRAESFRISMHQNAKKKMRSTTSDLDAALALNDRFIADPHAWHHFCWDLVGTMLVILDYCFVPLQVFNNDIETSTLKVILSVTTTWFWTADGVRTFFVGYHDKGILVMNARHIAQNYIRTWALFDLSLLLLNWVHVFFILLSVSKKVASPMESFRLLRVLKMFRVLKAVEERVESEQVSIILKIVKQLSSIILMCHLIACAWFTIGDATSRNGPSWVASYGISEAASSYQYTSSFHWALTQFTPASIEIQPTNVYERAFAIVTLLCALIMFSLFVSGITDALLDLRTLSHAKERQFWLLRKYLSECSIPKEVSLRVQRYCTYAWENRTRFVQENAVNLLDMLSTPLRAELRTAIFEPRMAMHPLFVLLNKLAPLTMQLLCTNAVSRVMLAHGDLLFQGGQLASQMNFVTAGTLAYEPHQREELLDTNDSECSSCNSRCSDADIILTLGSWVGEAVLWVEWTYVGSLSAVTECDLVALDADKFQASVCSNVKTRAEAMLYAKGFLLGLNRIDKSKITDLFQSGLLEGLWFRLLNEYNVKRRGRPGVMSNSVLFNTKVAAAISSMLRNSTAENER